MKESAKDRGLLAFMYLFIGAFTVLCLIPIVLTFSVSLTAETAVVKHGYTLIPTEFSLAAYTYIVVALRDKLLTGFSVSLGVTVLGTLLSMAVTATFAYALSVRSFRHRGRLAVAAVIPMLFSAGILPWFIILTKYYALSNKFYAMFLPSAMNLFFVFLLRNFFLAVPQELSEAARMDGAGHGTTFLRIFLPVTQVGVVTIALFYALGYWNDFYLALMFINNQDMFPLQYYLYNMLNNAEFAATNAKSLGYTVHAPLETIKMALTCITLAPIIVAFPFIQKYFAKGIIVGSVKG